MDIWLWSSLQENENSVGPGINLYGIVIKKSLDPNLELLVLQLIKWWLLMCSFIHMTFLIIHMTCLNSNLFGGDSFKQVWSKLVHFGAFSTFGPIQLIRSNFVHLVYFSPWWSISIQFSPFWPIWCTYLRIWKDKFELRAWF